MELDGHLVLCPQKHNIAWLGGWRRAFFMMTIAGMVWQAFEVFPTDQ